EGGVVVGALGDRELEDRGIRGHTHDTAFAHQAIELARGQVAAADEVEPDALAEGEELFGTAGHGGTPFRGRETSARTGTVAAFDFLDRRMLLARAPG